MQPLLLHCGGSRFDDDPLLSSPPPTTMGDAAFRRRRRPPAEVDLCCCYPPRRMSFHSDDQRPERKTKWRRCLRDVVSAGRKYLSEFLRFFGDKLALGQADDPCRTRGCCSTSRENHDRNLSAILSSEQLLETTLGTEAKPVVVDKDKNGGHTYRQDQGKWWQKPANTNQIVGLDGKDGNRHHNGQLEMKSRPSYPAMQGIRTQVQNQDDAFAPLTHEEEKEVHKIFYSNVDREQLLISHKASNIVVTKETLQCLRNGAWLNDEVINLYLALLKERELREPKRFLKCHFFNTFFYEKLTSGNIYNYDSVSRWTSHEKLKYHLMDCDRIFVPVHKHDHWCLLIINVRNKTFTYLDFFGGCDKYVVNVLATYICDEAKDKSKLDIDVRSWQVFPTDNLPRQQNGSDCGIFMLKYIDFESRGRGFDFSQRDMLYFRKRTAIELLRLRAE